MYAGKLRGEQQERTSLPEALAFVRPVPSVCWTAKQPPNGPATALLRHRTVQMLPVEAPMQLKLSGICTFMTKSCSLAWERPNVPGTLFETFSGVKVVTALLVSSMSHSKGPAPSALTYIILLVAMGQVAAILPDGSSRLASNPSLL